MTPEQRAAAVVLREHAEEAVETGYRHVEIAPRPLLLVLDALAESEAPLRTWRSPCGLYEVIVVPPLNCPSCGSKAWATQGDEPRL